VNISIRRVCGALLAVAITARADNAWDVREARFLREQLYSQIAHLPDLVRIKQAFEAALANDASAASELVALVRHSNDDVAGAAAQALGRFPGERASATLRDVYTRDARFLVRAQALFGLARMRDPATARFALAALNDENVIIQGAGRGALEGLADRAYSVALLQYMDRRSPGEAHGDLLLAAGKLGDPPGSTAVRDRLVSEAHKRTNDFEVRYAAARGLKEMGLAELARPIFDIAYARNTSDSLIVVKSAMEGLAARWGMTVTRQIDVDTLLKNVKVGRHEQDTWGRSLRAKLVSAGVFHVVSNGPDRAADTADDLSTAEAVDAYLDRVFPDQFLTP
jgi:HEAT repeat protein